MKLIKEIVNGVEITRIKDEKYQYTIGYYSENKWADPDRVILARTGSDLTDDKAFYEDCCLVEVNLKTGEEKVVLDKKVSHYHYLVYGEKLYYFYENEFRVKNLETGEDTFLCIEEKVCMLFITVDGRYINFEKGANDKGEYECAVLDLETGEHYIAFEKSFNKPFREIDHMMMCPTDKDKIFFAHEGDTFYVSNRLWLWQKDKGMHCIAKQCLDEEGNLGDCFGHECWMPDGRGLYFVKYPCSPTPPTGICYVDVEGNQTDVLFGKYGYWHVSCAPNGKCLGADAMGNPKSEVCLIDLESKREILVESVDFRWPHPNHPHPSFNTDSTRICYNAVVDGKITVNFAQVEELLK